MGGVGVDPYRKIRYRSWATIDAKNVLNSAADITEFEQDVEMELRRRGHRAPGEGQRIYFNGGQTGRCTTVTKWVTTYLGWSATGDDVDRGARVVADELEQKL